MPDGTVRSAAVEASLDEGAAGAHELGVGGKVVLGVMGLCLWMLLMTATYFHTWFEKLTGLLVALAALYSVYILPRWVPPLRKVLSLPGI
ncbi:hypothetical protein VTK73DRAFT_7040 [Phialemonium thermophilum]|uniref:Uncharacterized protein n=1 Tax=Phialemonium thermophilum TaxID=223376 RepID=A0ABR3WGT4_9PEZI